MFTYAFFFCLIVFLSLYLPYRYVRFRRKAEQGVAGPPVASLLLGNLDRFMRQRNTSRNEHLQHYHQSFSSLFATYRKDGVMRLWLGPFTVVYFLTKANYVQKLLGSQDHLNKSVAYTFLSGWLGEGLLTANAAIWRPRRKLLSPGFHVKVLHAFLPIFSRHTALFLETLENSQGPSVKGTACVEIDSLLPLFESLALDIIKETALGSDQRGTKQEAGSLAYRDALKGAFFLAAQRMTVPLLWSDSLFACSTKGRTFGRYISTLNNYAETMILKRAKVSAKAPSQGARLLDLLLRKAAESPGEMSLQSMKAEVNTLILGGYDTAAIALTFTTLLLGRHPQVQETVFLELQAIFADSMERDITVDDLRRMRYLEMVIKETLRLYPPAQTLGRSLSGPLALPNGAILPAGSTVLINLDSYHRDPQYFPAPDVFLPERFAPDAQTPIHPYAYLPFSSGPRNCIGQRFAMLELKLVLASLFRKYRVTSRTEPESVIRAVSPFLKPLADIGVMLEKREN